jgi:hypothetical protein
MFLVIFVYAMYIIINVSTMLIYYEILNTISTITNWGQSIKNKHVMFCLHGQSWS